MAQLTHARLTGVLEYNATTGIFRWKITLSSKGPAGKRAGKQDKRGYRYIKIDGTGYLEHRLAWFYVHKKWPADLIDHRNMRKSRNRIRNLREATHSTNKANRRAQKNSKSRIKGVHWSPRYRKWVAQIMVNRRTIYLGRHQQKQSAVSAYRVASIQYFGEYARS